MIVRPGVPKATRLAVGWGVRFLSQHLAMQTTAKGAPVYLSVDIMHTPSSFGYYSSRVNRPYNEDRYQVGVLDVDMNQRNVVPGGSLEGDNPTLQARIDDTTDPEYSNHYDHTKVFHYSVFDGHGGDECSSYLTTHLSQSVEGLKTTEGTVNELMDFYKKKIGGYWKRWTRRENENVLKAMGLQERLHVEGNKKELLFRSSTLNDRKKKLWQFDEFQDQVTPYDFFKFRVFMSFLYTDYQFMTYENKFNKITQEKAQQIAENVESMEKQQEPHLINSGSTCTSAFIYTLKHDENDPNGYYYEDKVLSRLLVAQVGDTRAILCDSNGVATALSRDHHPSNPTEARRLTKFSANLIMTDSFGEQRYLNFANTRSFGDISAKDVGVSAEPEFFDFLIGDPRMISMYKNQHADYLKKMGIKDFGGNECFLVLVSDGVTNSASDQEVVDIVMSSGSSGGTPADGAKAVVDYVEDVNGDDNSTCLVIRLNGWGRWPRKDRTAELRANRLQGGEMYAT